MGAIELEPTASLTDELDAERCVGEGGHLFERTGERLDTGEFRVTCERCLIDGWEQPDAFDILEDQPRIA